MSNTKTYSQKMKILRNKYKGENAYDYSSYNEITRESFKKSVNADKMASYIISIRRSDENQNRGLR